MKKLTMKQKNFSDEYLKTGNATKSALSVYETKKYSTASSIGSENLKKPKIIEYLQSKSEKCAENIFTLANEAKNESVRLQANRDLLDRAGYKPNERIESEFQTRVGIVFLPKRDGDDDEDEKDK